MTSKFKLCYVEKCFAYFTPKELSEQRGDDWNDAPYEHNAGLPYDDERIIKKVAFDGNFATPRDLHFNSPYSVDAINAGAVAWLVGSNKESKPVVINAGISVEEFITKIEEAEGEVYLRVKDGYKLQT